MGFGVKWRSYLAIKERRARENTEKKKEKSSYYLEKYVHKSKKKDDRQGRRNNNNYRYVDILWKSSRNIRKEVFENKVDQGIRVKDFFQTLFLNKSKSDQKVLNLRQYKNTRS